MQTPEASSSRPTPAVDVVTKVIGSFGRYHLWLCFIIFLSKIPVALNQMAIIFLAPKISYKCNGQADVCPCTEPVYDTSVFKQSIVMKWGLICGRKFLTSLCQTLFQFGTLIGSVLFGMASDRYGRKYPMLLAVVLQVSSGILAAFAPNYWLFTFLRFVTGASVGGTMVIGFVIVMEYVGTKYRDITSALYQVPFNLGHMLLPLFGYFFRYYYSFQLAISIPTLFLLSYFYFLPDTPRWLIAMKRTDEAIALMERVAKINNRPTDNIKGDVQAFQAAMEAHHLKKGNITDLFRTPNLRKNILVMAFDWLTCSYCFYGVSQFVGQLSGNVFANIAASASVTMLGTFLSIPLMRLAGRRNIVIVFNYICAACLFILAVIPEGIGSVFCATIGVVSSFIVFVLVYLYCSELFPTVVRNAAIGFSSMSARVGSMIAPFIIALKDVANWLPPVAFAVLPLIAGSITFLLPETKGCELMTTIEEGEEFGKTKKSQVQ